MEEKDVLKMIKTLDEMKDNPKLKVLLHYLDFFDKACDFVLSNGEAQKEQSALSHMPLEESLKISKKFLELLSSTYPQVMDGYIQNNSIKIVDNSKEQSGYGHVSLDENGQVKILCGVHLDIDDVYLIVHEFMHSINAKGKNSKDREVLTEGFAIYSELLVSDFLERMNIRPEESYKFIRRRFNSVFGRAIELKEKINVIKYIRNNPGVVDSLREKTKDFSYDERLLESFQYTFGNFVAQILYGRREKGLFTNEDFVRLNEKINTSDNFKVFSELFPRGLILEELTEGYEKVSKLISNHEVAK